LTELSQLDPKAAAAGLSQITDQALQDQTMAQIADNWGMQDMPGAMGWVRALYGNSSNMAPAFREMRELIHSWGTNDPAAVAAYVQNNPAYTGWVESVETIWLSADPQAALAWAKSLPADAGGNMALGEYIIQTTNSDPAWSLNAALQTPLGSNQNKVLNSVITKWATQDPAAAGPALLTALPPNSSQLNSAISQVAENWIKQDQQGASQWIDSLPASPAKDSAVSQLISTVMQTNPTSALQWASSIGNASMRANQISQVVNTWAQTDPAAATTAAQNANVTEQQRANMLDKIQRLASKNSN
jgi:hypothetical protein